MISVAATLRRAPAGDPGETQPSFLPSFLFRNWRTS
jgi:hypothetical protein